MSSSTARTALDEIKKEGDFVRTDAAWRSWISKDPNSKFAAEKDRYHLYVSYACPWAHRTLIVRELKGLNDIISVTVVHPTWQRTKPNDINDKHTGWMFGNPDKNNNNTLTNTDGNGGPFPLYYDDTTLDPIDINMKSIRNIYEKCNDINGKYSVPILYDKKLNTIVNNESSDIIRMMNTEFNNLSTNPTLDLYPIELQNDINNVNDWIYNTINNGVYKCGFATTQIAYNNAITSLTESFHRINNILQKQRYIVGNGKVLTEADIRLFVTLIRFDEVYCVYFKTNTCSVQHTESILNYCRDIYQTKNIKDTVNMEHIKVHYYTSHPKLNYYSIIPKGIDYIKLLNESHNRDILFPN